jgi:peptide/nickel transport system substrate-binding protein
MPNKSHSLARLASVAIVAALAVAVAGCTGGSSSSSSGSTTATSKTSLTLAVAQDIPGWDPSLQTGAGSLNWITQAVWDTIFNCGPTGQIQPNVAESYTFTTNNTKLTLNIRPGMKFSDGSPVDATAVEASIKYQASHGVGQSRLAGLTVSAPSSSTVVVTSAKPDPALPTYFCISEGIVTSAQWLSAGKFSSPIGSGPYVYDQAASTPGSVYIFTKNNSNWDAKQFPYQKLIVKVISDPTATLNALKTGEIAAAVTGPSTVNEAKASGLKQVITAGNWAGLILADRNGKVIPALGNVKVRQAINMVFDKPLIASALYQGLATPTNQIFRQGTAAYINGLQNPYPYDVAKAKALMASAGYAGGFSVQIPLVEGVDFDAELPVVIQQLSLLNIKATQVTLSGPNTIANLLSGKYPIIYWPLGNEGNSLFDVYNDIAPTGVWNVEHATDPTVTALLQKLSTDSPAASAADQKTLNQYIINQAWFAPMVVPNLYTTYNPALVTINGSTDLNGLTVNLRDFQ